MDAGLYVAGYVAAGSYTYPCYWEGGTFQVLQVPSGDNGFSTGIAVDGSGNVYITGYTVDSSGSVDTPAYWENGTITLLPEGSGVFGKAEGIAFDSSGTVYITGYIETGNANAGYVYQPCYWENGTLYTLTTGSYAEGYALTPWFGSSGNLYIGGSVGSDVLSPTPAYWEDTAGTVALTTISPGTGNSNGEVFGGMFDGSGNMYLVGDGGGSSSRVPGDWQNGTFSALPLGSGNSALSLGGFAMDGSGNLYVAGSVGTSSMSPLPVFWENGSQTSLPMGAGNTVGGANPDLESQAGSVAIDSQGNVYIAGFVGTSIITPIAVYWKNGTLVTLPTSSSYPYANAVAITSTK